jgi:glucokinase
MAGFVDENGAVLAADTVPTPRAGGPAAVADESVRLLKALAVKYEIPLSTTVGIGSTVPGLADGRAGVMRYAPAHGWRDIPWAQMLSDRLGGLPARIANDVNACALAEQRFGAGQGVENLVWMTISTGIGGGLVLGGRIFEGGGGIAGEIGHLIVNEGGFRCGCGHQGCLEAEAAGPAIARRAREAGLAAGDAVAVAELARIGDPDARRVMQETAIYLGRAIAWIYNILDPDLVVLGGGVARSLDLLLPTITDTVCGRAILLPERPPRIVLTALGYEAALIGAAALVL